MKKLLYIAVVLAGLVAFASCSKEVQGDELTGAWQLVETTGAQLGQGDAVYVEFVAGGSFSIWQKLGTTSYRLYKGSYTLVDGVMSGVYDNGVPMESTYNVERSGNSLKLLPEGNAEAMHIYAALPAIPEEVLGNAYPATKSAADYAPFL